jgi:NAD(P)-dependent dehydrogenase (short-subunit alcohol dehydrogenase family)
MTHAMAREWGRHGINTNAICPGYIATEISADYLKTEAGAKFVASLPRRRMGEPRDLDALMLLLCSGQSARFLNGSIIAADDGFTSF